MITGAPGGLARITGPDGFGGGRISFGRVCACTGFTGTGGGVGLAAGRVTVIGSGVTGAAVTGCDVTGGGVTGCGVAGCGATGCGVAGA